MPAVRGTDANWWAEARILAWAAREDIIVISRKGRSCDGTSAGIGDVGVDREKSKRLSTTSKFRTIRMFDVWRGHVVYGHQTTFFFGVKESQRDHLPDLYALRRVQLDSYYEFKEL